MKLPLFFLILVLPLAVFAKSVKKPEANIEKRKPAKNADAPIVLTTAAPNFCLFGGQSGKNHSGEAAFKSIVWKNDVVYVGETHDQPLDHMAQLEALKAMKIARGSKIAVGFEMLNQTLQPLLNDYADGKMTEEEFLAKIDWKKEWGFDFAMYKPLFDFIVQNKLRAIALNVPKKVVGKIARTGLESLTPEEKQYLPEKVEITQHKKYNEYLKSTFGGHGSSPMAKMFTEENYLASMAAWNEGMGARVADFLAANPGYSVLVIAGNGHLLYNAAIPASVKARAKDVRQVSFYTETAAKCPETLPKEHKDLANYVWYINHPPKPEPPAALPALSTATLSVSPSTSTVPGQ
ncbi:MAG: ChaN family lipoprotein [Elusimicrobiales bacterium]|nr:ChaN family lipoprotein [Elusimicrobiales bacterium]